MSRGEPVAILWASEGPIYGRYGYGLAVPEISIELERDRAAFKTPVDPRGRVRLLPHADAAKVMAEVYNHAHDGPWDACTRSSEWWESHTFADHDEPKEPRPSMRCSSWTIGPPPTPPTRYTRIGTSTA